MLFVDFEGLEREIVRRVEAHASGRGEAPDALVMFEAVVPVRVIVATAERVRGEACNTARVESCRVRRLAWDAQWDRH
jgi:hypothetical protein